MSTLFKKPTVKAVLLLSAVGLAVLAGCGGGGGGSTGGTTPTQPTAPDPGNLLTTLPTSTYPANTREYEIFAELNAARGTDFGYLRQSASLDTAAKAHAVYLQTVDVIPQIGPDGTQYTENGVPIFEFGPSFGIIDPATGSLGAHIEKVGKPGFTGITATDRAKTAGYTGTASEVVAQEYAVSRASNNPCVTQLLTSVFHRGALLNPSFGDVGIGLSSLPSMTQRVCVINPGTSTEVKAPEGWTGIYPANGAVNVVRAMWNDELPNPVPEFALKGNPVSLYVQKGTLNVTKFTLTGPSGTLSTKLLTSTVFPNYIGSGQAYIVPNGALARNTKYTVVFEGTADGKAVARTWSFTTVASDNRCDDGKTLGCN